MPACGERVVCQVPSASVMRVCAAVDRAGDWAQTGDAIKASQDRTNGFNLSPPSSETPGVSPRPLFASVETYSAAGAVPPAFFLAAGLSAFGFAAALPLATLGGAGVISNDGALSLIRTLTSPPLTSLPNSNSSASGCLIFSC